MPEIVSTPVDSSRNQVTFSPQVPLSSDEAAFAEIEASMASSFVSGVQVQQRQAASAAAVILDNSFLIFIKIPPFQG